jgi:cysteine synthase
VVGVDTVGSVYEYYFENNKLPPQDDIHQYLIDGIGEDFMPATVWWDWIDDVVTVDDETAYRAVFELTRTEAIFTGSSGGAAVAAARDLARSLPEDALVVTLLPDSGERYLSKLNRGWMEKQGIHID